MENATMNRVQAHYDEIVARYGEWRVIAVCLVGSQNYGLDEETSDVDTKAIILPTLEDIIMLKEPVSTTIMLDNGEQIAVKDVRLFVYCLEKQNVNFVETLFTNYCIVNPKWEELWNKLLKHREIIARHNPQAMAECFVGIIRTRIKYAFIGGKGKDLYVIERTYYMLFHYLKAMSFDLVLNRSDERHYLLRIKHGEYHEEVAQKFLEDAERLIDVYNPQPDHAARGYLSNWLHAVMTTFLREELDAT